MAAGLKPVEIPGGPSSNGTGAELVYARLREAILNGQLAPDHVFSQVQLARELGVSRTPLREAVRMLQREGLIAGEANRMVRVAPLSIQDLEELYALRIANEVVAIHLTVPAMTDEDDAFLDECLREMARFATDGDVDTWEQHHRAFHTRLVNHAGTRLRDLLSELYDLAERYRRLYIMSVPRAMSIGAGEHQAIVAACRSRDAQRAAAELARHLSRTALSALMQIAPEHDPATVRGALRAVLNSNEGLRFTEREAEPAHQLGSH
jgi:GntR family transcriptional regulator, rspAB operon transcriptional repressor